MPDADSGRRRRFRIRTLMLLVVLSSAAIKAEMWRRDWEARRSAAILQSAIHSGVPTTAAPPIGVTLGPARP